MRIEFGELKIGPIAKKNLKDVIKTRIQTQGEFGRSYTIKETIKYIKYTYRS